MTVRPELRKALDASWERNEGAYRYLGRSSPRPLTDSEASVGYGFPLAVVIPLWLLGLAWFLFRRASR